MKEIGSKLNETGFKLVMNQFCIQKYDVFEDKWDKKHLKTEQNWFQTGLVSYFECETGLESVLFGFSGFQTQIFVRNSTDLPTEPFSERRIKPKSEHQLVRNLDSVMDILTELNRFRLSMY